MPFALIIQHELYKLAQICKIFRCYTCLLGNSKELTLLDYAGIEICTKAFFCLILQTYLKIH